ncbi:hypothetical protein SAMN04487764_3042 [Gillisia sp. Hel1_33_143]|uniref:hypothetical protein n=1 Tax=Gillisia sp. Hel1_33_143 TaxID=1336796 RepID=UPI0008799D27|nr:hypothetical protein [Gillisia sp. Hel1_33_143]SDS78068.1 hypothetical protein SAMN04487764_3042 [Gillisia sp. Hel1_33_143]
MTILSAPYSHFKRSRKQLLILVSVWQETLSATKKEISFLEMYIASPIFYITPELLTEFIRYQAHLKKLKQQVEIISALANKHFTVIQDWTEVDNTTLENFILLEHQKIEPQLLEFIKNYNNIKLDIFNYTGDKLIQKEGN